jgi:hypothetical protein
MFQIPLATPQGKENAKRITGKRPEPLDSTENLKVSPQHNHM